MVPCQTVRRNFFQRIFPFLYPSSTRRLSSLFCTRSDTRIAIYIMVAFVFLQVKMARWQMDRKDRGVDEEKGRRSSTWKDSTNLFALSATARLKGSSSRSLVKSSTCPLILSSVEIIHDRERQTKYSFPITRSICFFRIRE